VSHTVLQVTVLQRHVLQTGRQLCRVHNCYKALQVGRLCPNILHDYVRERGWVYFVISEELPTFGSSLVVRLGYIV